MKLIYDASASLLPLTGVGRYTTELLRAMLANWPEGEPPPTVWLNSLRRKLSGERLAFLRRAADDRMVKLVRTRFPGPALLAGWEWFGWPSAELVVGRGDVVHCPAAYIAPAHFAARVVTIHDLHAVRNIEDGAPLGGTYLAGTLPDRLPTVEAVIVPSIAVRGEVLSKYTRVQSNRVFVVPEGVNAKWFEGPDPDRVKAVLLRRGINSPYVLTVGTLEPRKNHHRLFRAMAIWRREAAPGEEVPLLVGVGRHGWGGVTVDRLCGESGLDSKWVRWVGNADDDELRALYAGARVVVEPSLWEGFGLPALEAMACGKPLVVSDQGGLPEVVGDTAVLIDPYEVRDILRKLAEVVQASDERQQEMGRHALDRARLFTWAAAARKTMDVYRTAATLR